MRQYGGDADHGSASGDAPSPRTRPRRPGNGSGHAAGEASGTSVPELVFHNTLLKLSEAAQETGTSLKTLQRAYTHGHLRVVPFGTRGKRLRRGDVLAWQDAGMPTSLRKEPRR